MIRGISSSGKYVMVSGGSTSPPNISPGSTGAGMLRWNPNMNCMEVNDGNIWKTLDMSHSNVGLTSEAESLLDWAKKKKEEELEIENLAKNHPAVRSALEAVHRAQEQLKLIKDLSIEHEPS